MRLALSVSDKHRLASGKERVQVLCELPTAAPKPIWRSYGRLADLGTFSSRSLRKQTVTGTTQRAQPRCGRKSGKAGRAGGASGSLARSRFVNSGHLSNPFRFSLLGFPAFFILVFLGAFHGTVQPLVAKSNLPRSSHSLQYLRNSRVRPPLRISDLARRSADRQAQELPSVSQPDSFPQETLGVGECCRRTSEESKRRVALPQIPSAPLLSLEQLRERSEAR